MIYLLQLNYISTFNLPTAISGKLNKLFRIFSLRSPISVLEFNFNNETVIAIISLPDIIEDKAFATRLTVSRSSGKVVCILL